jgi:hypothetical protein
MIGMSPRIGRGRLRMLSTRWCVPITVGCSSVNIARAMRSASSSRSKRSAIAGKSYRV